jgi:protein involved in temperature-dependent protein secretion
LDEKKHQEEKACDDDDDDDDNNKLHEIFSGVTNAMYKWIPVTTVRRVLSLRIKKMETSYWDSREC